MRIAFGLQAGLFRVLDFGPAYGLDPSGCARSAMGFFLCGFRLATCVIAPWIMKNTWPLSVYVVRNPLKGAVFGVFRICCLLTQHTEVGLTMLAQY